MKIIELTVSKSQTVQHKQYEPTNYFCSLKAALEITDNIDTIAEDLFSQCEQLIRVEISNDKGLVQSTR